MEWKSTRLYLAEIARRLSVTRTAVSRWVPHLRVAGVRQSPLAFVADLRAPILLGLALLLTFAPFFLVAYIKDDDYLFSLFAKSDPPALYASQAYTGRVLNGILLYETLPWVD